MIAITNAELARRLRKPTLVTLEILRDFQAAGIAEQHDGRWRLTDEGEREFGCLRRLPVLVDHDGVVPATSPPTGQRADEDRSTTNYHGRGGATHRTRPGAST